MGTIFHELLEQKKRLWEEYYALTLRQREFLTPDRVEELHQVLDSKDDLIRRLRDLEERWETLAREGGLHPKELEEEELKDREKAIQEIILRVQETEKLALREAQELLSNLRNEIERFSRVREAAWSYGGHRQAVHGAFVDQSR